MVPNEAWYAAQYAKESVEPSELNTFLWKGSHHGEHWEWNSMGFSFPRMLDLYRNAFSCYLISFYLILFYFILFHFILFYFGSFHFIFLFYFIRLDYRGFARPVATEGVLAKPSGS